MQTVQRSTHVSIFPSGGVPLSAAREGNAWAETRRCLGSKDGGRPRHQGSARTRLFLQSLDLTEAKSTSIVITLLQGPLPVSPLVLVG